MKIFIIAIVMFWADTSQTPEKDAYEITMRDGLPLQFASRQKCFEFVDENFVVLTEFGHQQFPTADAVKYIYCVERAAL